MADSIEIALIGQKCYNFFTKGWGKQHLIRGEKMNDAVKIPNLVLRGKTYHAQFYNRYRKRVRMSLRTRDKKTAIDRLRNFINKTFDDEYFDIRKPIIKTFSELADEFLEYSKDHTPERYAKVHKSKVASLKAYFGEKCLNEITVPLINQYQKYRKDDVSANCSNDSLKVLGRLFNYSIKNNYYKVNPVKGIENYKIPKKIRRILTNEEFLKLMSVCCQLLVDIIVLALSTGMRKIEIRTVKWDNVDLINKRIILNETKNGKIRDFPITNTVFKLLSRRFEEKTSEYVFPNEEGSYYRDFRMFEKAVKLAGIKKLCFHDLRRTYCTNLNMLKTNVFTLQKLMDHSKLETTLIYVNQDEQEKRDALEKLEIYMFGNKTGSDTN